MKKFIERFQKVIRRKIVHSETREELLSWVSKLDSNKKSNLGKILFICKRYNIKLAYLFGKSYQFNGYVEQDLKININGSKIKIDSAYRSRLLSYQTKEIEKISIKTLFKYAELIGRDPYELINGK